ncbi:MAG: indolepyruvate oxidoreductase subunit beta [Chloroflexi bacterium]|nr:indolepyruvate oxidoreductase subunit beta [Chloroflexota bacterium]
MELNILVAGVGGQGNLFASSILAEYLLQKGYKVLAVETIGAAQRGGSVVSHLRISDAEIYSPLIPAGKVDILMGFEASEMLRNFELLAPDGIYLLNDYKEPTVLCNMEMDTYPSDEEIRAALKKSGKKGYTIKATERARQIGGSLLTNVVMVGALCQISPLFISQEVKQVLAGKSPVKVKEQNLQAFDAGGSLIQEAVRKS